MSLGELSHLIGKGSLGILGPKSLLSQLPFHLEVWRSRHASSQQVSPWTTLLNAGARLSITVRAKAFTSSLGTLGCTDETNSKLSSQECKERTVSKAQRTI